MYIFSPSTVIKSSEVNANFQEVLGMAGEMRLFGGSAAPSGWLLCQGQAVSRVTYAALYNIIGTIYGEGNGSSTFNVPDLQDRVPIGKSGSRALGSTGGSETAAHTHAGPNHTHQQGAHRHQEMTDADGGYGGGNRQVQASGAAGHNDTGDGGPGTNTYAAGTGNTSETSPSVVQPYQAINYIIKI